MKNLICILFCLMVVNLSIGQTSNKERLKELPALIEEAGTNKDYKQAAKLQDELEIREELQQAIDREDYKKATALRENLYDLENGDYNSDDSNSDIAEEEEETKGGNSKDNSVLYMDFTVAGINSYAYSTTDFVETYDQSGNYTGLQEQTFDVDERMYSINFKFGNKFYFGPGTRKFRIGLDINFISLNIGLNLEEDLIVPNLDFSTPCPGFVMTYHLNDNMGVDFQANAGIMFLLSEFNDIPLPAPGLAVNPQLRFWYNKLGVGLSYTYHQVNTLDNIDRLTLNHMGLFVGLRF
jgi:hypothetical protein